MVTLSEAKGKSAVAKGRSDATRDRSAATKDRAVATKDQSADANLKELDGALLESEDWSCPCAAPLVPASADLLDLATVLQALSDPVRLLIVAKLADGLEYTCGSFNLPVAKSTCSHHFRVLREAGVVQQRIEGKCRYNRLRTEHLEQRFPGLLKAVLTANQVKAVSTTNQVNAVPTVDRVNAVPIANQVTAVPTTNRA